MEYSNNHYIPQFILRRFGTKINRYNVKTGEIKVKGSTINAFSGKNIYPEWLEHKFADLESKIANLIDNKILNADKTVTISRAENMLIKKFFAAATLRVPDASIFSKKHLEDETFLKQNGFKEVNIDGESNEDYAFRTLKVILESDSIEDLYKHPQVTYEACKWFLMFYYCYLTVWDSSKAKEDFIITDNGMNCEHDKTRFKSFVVNGVSHYNEKDEILKGSYIIKKLMECNGDEEKHTLYLNLANKIRCVHANYYLFAVSSTRTIALINPFFRLYDDTTSLKITNEVPNVWPTLLSREAMKCNTGTYVHLGEFDNNDLFHYDVKDLSLEEVIIINNMMLDRVFRLFGFDESARIIRSLSVYSLIDTKYQRKNYDKLKEYLRSLGYEFAQSKKYREIAKQLICTIFTDEEIEYIEYFYNLIPQK